MADLGATARAGRTQPAQVSGGLALFSDWDTGLWVAGAVLLVVAAFVLGLWLHGRTRA